MLVLVGLVVLARRSGQGAAQTEALQALRSELRNDLRADLQATAGHIEQQQLAVLTLAVIGDVVQHAGVAAGGDNLNLTGVTPFVLDNAKATASARSVAVANAKAKAKSYAKLIGGTLGRVQFVIENSSPNISAPIMAVAKDAMGATQVDLGQQDVTVSISVRYTLN